jgi:hypothetical protein
MPLAGSDTSEPRMATIKKKRPKVNVRQVFTALVIFMWVASFLMDMANPAYDPPAYVNPLIMLVGGYLFATSTNKEDT